MFFRFWRANIISFLIEELKWREKSQPLDEGDDAMGMSVSMTARFLSTQKDNSVAQNATIGLTDAANELENQLTESQSNNFFSRGESIYQNDSRKQTQESNNEMPGELTNLANFFDDTAKEKTPSIVLTSENEDENDESEKSDEEESENSETVSDDKPFSCSKCEKRFSTQKEREDHGLCWKPFECCPCNKKFASVKELEIHSKTHSNVKKGET